MRNNTELYLKTIPNPEPKSLTWLWLFLFLGAPIEGLTQTTYYLTTGTNNPQSGSITYYDLSTTAGSSSNGMYLDPNQTAVDYAAEGAAGTYNYYIVPGINMGSPESSTSLVTTSTGFGWETAVPLACDVSAGTWTFSDRFEANIGAGSPAVYVEVSVYTFNGTSSSLLFNYTDTTNISGSLSPGTPYTYSFTTNQGAFSGIAGQSLKVEYYVQMVGPGAYAGGYVYLGYNTGSDFVTVPVCPPPTNTQTDTATATSTGTSTSTDTYTATNTATNTSTDTSTNTSTDTATSTATETSTSTSTDTATDTPTDTATDSSTDTATNTSTNTATATATNTVTNTSTATASDTSTDTAINTNTQTSTATSTATNTLTCTDTCTQTATNTNTAINTNTGTSTATLTSTPTSTQTSTSTVASTATSTQTPTSTPTVTNTATANIHVPVVIYPNPYTGNGPINIQAPLDSPGDIRVSIFSLSFRKVQEQDFPNGVPGVSVTMNLNDKNGYELANGLYYVRIKTALGTNLLKLLILR